MKSIAETEKTAAATGPSPLKDDGDDNNDDEENCSGVKTE